MNRRKALDIVGFACVFGFLLTLFLAFLFGAITGGEDWSFYFIPNAFGEGPLELGLIVFSLAWMIFIGLRIRKAEASP